MMKTLLMRGMLAGAIAGVFAFGFAHTFGEPQVDRAIAFEEAHSDGHKHSHDAAPTDATANMSTPAEHADQAEPAEEEPVSRSTQATIGLLTAAVVYGAGIGGLFSLVFALVQGRTVTFNPRTTAALLAVAAFISVALVPALKFPPNPPAVGQSETIGLRTEAYFLMILVSVAAMSFSVSLTRRLTASFGIWNSALFGTVAFIAIVAIAQIILPTINEVPDDFPADLLWKFRVSSLGIQLIMWGGIGILFGVFAERAMNPTRLVAHQA